MEVAGEEADLIEMFWMPAGFEVYRGRAITCLDVVVEPSLVLSVPLGDPVA